MKGKQNWISQLKDTSGQSVDDPDKLKEMVRQFYIDLYTGEDSISPNRGTWEFSPLSYSNISWINRLVTKREVRRADFEMKGGKASGSDGYPSKLFLEISRSCGLVSV